jgi:ferric-dicitrate binding protein FerR (iron transport regulator)
MKPGDLVEYAEKQILKKTVTKTDYLAWTESKLVFDNTTLKDLASIIKEHYGVEVKIEDEKLAQKTITGIMPNDNLETLLQSLEATQEFNIERTKAIITITNKVSN